MLSRPPLWARAVGLLLRLWARSLRIERTAPDVVDAALAAGPVVLACWHGELLPLALAHRDRGIAVLVSRSRDGGRLAAVLTALGYRCVRGSTSRGARAGALAAHRHLAAGGALAVAVDGPRCPRHVAAPGALRLARGQGAPLVAVRARCRGLVLSSWDRAVLPWPGTRVALASAVVPPGGALAAALGD